MVEAVDHDQTVGEVGNFTAQAQVTQYHVERDIGAYRHDIHVHQAAGGIFRVGQDGFQPMAVLLVHGVQQFVDYCSGQVVQQVGEVIRVQTFDYRYQLVGFHFLNETGAYFIVHFNEGFALVFGIDQFPQDFTRAVWQGLEQVADFGGVKTGQQLAYLVSGTAVQGGCQDFQALLCVFLVGCFCHNEPRGWVRIGLPAQCSSQTAGKKPSTVTFC